MYRKIQTPNSPLSPLPPCNSSSEYLVDKTPNFQFLTPSYPLKISHLQNKRRSFTPSAFDNVSPPTISPIDTVLESPDSDSSFMNSSILKSPVFSAINRKTCTDNRNAHSSIKRAYHCQRKNENRPSMNINITTLRRSLYTSFQSPSMSDEKGKKTDRWYDSPIQFNSARKPVKNDSNNSDGNLPVPIINKTFSLDEQSIAMDGNKSSPWTNSILNNNLTIESVLKEIGLQKYIEKFQLEEVDLFVFFQLNPEDLYKLEIDEGDHKIILQTIEFYENM